eukprot:4476073-Alexandrium_andersonii.AAC.1
MGGPGKAATAFVPSATYLSITSDFKTDAEAHNPAAGGCGTSAQQARKRLIPGPNSDEVGPPMI